MKKNTLRPHFRDSAARAAWPEYFAQVEPLVKKLTALPPGSEGEQFFAAPLYAPEQEELLCMIVYARPLPARAGNEAQMATSPFTFSRRLTHNARPFLILESLVNGEDDTFRIANIRQHLPEHSAIKRSRATPEAQGKPDRFPGLPYDEWEYDNIADLAKALPEWVRIAAPERLPEVQKMLPRPAKRNVGRKM